MAQKTVTAVNQAQIDTAQSKFGGASCLLDGADDHLTVPADTDWNMGDETTGDDFTFECFFRTADHTKDSQFFFAINGANTNDTNRPLQIVFRWDTPTAGNNGLEIFNGVDDETLDLGSALTDNQWYHLAIVRNGATITGYLDGSSFGTYTNNQIGNSGNTLYIGKHYTASAEFSGHLDEIRILKGEASDGSVPAGEYSGGGNTVLLLHCNGTDGSTDFIDDSEGAAAGGNPNLLMLGVQ